MIKFLKKLFVIVVAILLFYFGALMADKEALRTQIVRLHIVADSDSEEDQMIKLAVRDAIMDHLQVKMAGINDISLAQEAIQNELGVLGDIANVTLASNGCVDTVTVAFATEEFGKREYDTFSLPAGVYKSLRIQIGSGEGKNWWCVVFPSFCVPSSSEQFQTTAVSSGFDQVMVNTLSNDSGYEVRFFLLDCIGRIENFFNIS